MRINHKILSIPPYISTSWKNIASLHVERVEEQLILVINLTSGAKVKVPHLEPQIIEAIFAAHAKFMEQDPATIASKAGSPPSPNAFPESLLNMGFPLRIGSAGLEGIGGLMQHNPEQSDAAPTIPPEILNKIAAVAKAVGIDDPNAFPKPEPHCNCIHCQIMRTIHGEAPLTPSIEKRETPEEAVSDEDLKFRLWDIVQTSDKLYQVINPTDSAEQYSVYLGSPIGCTCGSKNCEHIRAVLNS